MADSAVKTLVDPWPWQQTVLKNIEERGTNRINIMVDVKGNTGKNTFCKWMAINKKAQMLPPMRKTNDLHKVVFQTEKLGVYVCKIPCAMRDFPLPGFWRALERISDGVCWNARKKKMFFDKPVIWMFVRDIPPVTKLYKHRFVFWRLENEDDPKNSELVKFMPDPDVIESRAKKIKERNKPSKW